MDRTVLSLLITTVRKSGGLEKCSHAASRVLDKTELQAARTTGHYQASASKKSSSTVIGSQAMDKSSKVVQYISGLHR